MARRSIGNQIEWELGSEPIVLERVAWPCPPFIQGTKRITIERDDEQQLRLLAEGTIDPDDLKARVESMRQMKAGTFVAAESIALEASAARYELTAFLDPVPSETYGREIRFRQRGSIERVLRTWTHKFVAGDAILPKLEPVGAPAFRSDWFLNGPKHADFMRWTTRRTRATYHREREYRTVVVNAMPSERDTRDHIVIDAGSFRFAVCKVPEEFVPHGHRGIAVEYSEPAPDEDTRESVAEILSFILGRRLLRLGSTTFDAAGDIVEEELINPAVQGIGALCAQPDSSPLPLKWHECEDIENQVSGLVRCYLRTRAEMDLRNAILAYWAACEAVVPIDLALFRGAVEALKTAWFSSKKTKSRGLYMPRAEYEELSREHVDALRTKLGDRDGAPAIVSKVQRACEMGSNQQVQNFFAEIGLPVGAVERAAHKAANAPAHGTLTGDEQEPLVRHGWAFRLLFERTLLKLLDYEGEYVDRTTPGFPQRPLLEPPAG